MKLNSVNGVSQINKIKCMRDYFHNVTQNQPIQMGLFTFYKQQQSQPQTPNTVSLKRANQLSKVKAKGRKKNVVYKYLRESQQQQIEPINKSMNCYDFLKNIGVKRSLRNRQSFIKRQELNYSNLNCTNSNEFSQVVENSRQDSRLDVQQQVESRYSNKKFDLGNSINEQSIPAYIIRKKYFNPHQIKEAPPKKFCRMEQNLIIKIQKKQLQEGPKFTKQTNKPKPQERLNLSFKANNHRNNIMKVESNREMLVDFNRQQLSTKNKKYIHNLMQSTSNKPQYNQIPYKTLRKVFKQPSFAHKFKTQGNSDLDNYDKNSVFFEKDTPLRQKQNSYFQHKYLRTAIQRSMGSHKLTQ